MRFRSNLIQAGRPMQNGYIERFNRIYKEFTLDVYLFSELDQMRTLTREWMEKNNLRRPYESPRNPTPNKWEMK
jgi:putative transposase